MTNTNQGDFFLPDFEPEDIGWPRFEYDADSEAMGGPIHEPTKDYFLRMDEQYEQDRMEMPNLFGTEANRAKYEGE